LAAWTGVGAKIHKADAMCEANKAAIKRVLLKNEGVKRVMIYV